MPIAHLEIPWQRYALIVELAERLQTERSQFGKTKLQKLIYLLQVIYGVKCGYDFELYTYGPFTSQVLQDLDQAQSLGGVNVTLVPTDPGGYQIEPGKNAEPVTNMGAGFLAEHEDKLDGLISEYGTYSAKELELRATVVFVSRDMDRDGNEVTADALTEMVHDIKLHFPREGIRSVVKELKAKGHVRVSADGS